MLLNKAPLLLLLFTLLAAFVLPAAAIGGKCGNDVASEAFSAYRHRRASSDMDGRYKLPSEDVPKSPPCAYVDEGVGQYGLSQCHVRRVIDGYLSTADWPHTDLSLGVITYAPASGTPWITSGQVAAAVNLLNQAYAPANIAFTHTLLQPTSQAAVNYFNANPVNVSTLDDIFATLARDFNISDRQADRQFAVYLAVLPTQYTEFVGLCFPIPGLLQEISNSIPLYSGGVCIVDPAFVLFPAISANANPQSRGFTPAHEIGHALGLQHPHNSVSQPKQVFANPPVFIGCTRSSTTPECVPTTNTYDTGDYIADLPPTPNPISYTNVFDENTCQTTSDFPPVCGGHERNLTADITNYMSYFPEQCTNRFSPMQIARMRCVIDRFLLPVRSLVITPRPLPPVALVTARLLNLTIARVEWSPPLHLLFYSDSRPATIPAPSNITYVLERQPAFASGPAVLPSDMYSYIDDTLTANVTYLYRVFARTPQGDGAHRGFTQASFQTATSSAWTFYLSLPLALALMLLVLAL